MDEITIKWKRFISNQTVTDDDGETGLSYSDVVSLRPGFLVKYSDDSVELVGELNANAGRCDCCNATRSIIEYSDYLVPILDAIIAKEELMFQLAREQEQQDELDAPTFN